MSKDKLYTAAAFFCTVLQTVILPTMKFNENQTVIGSIILISLVSIFTILKQRVSVEVNKNAEIATWLLIGIIAIGGVNEMIGYFHLDELVQTRLRGIVTGLLFFLNFLSKTWFPTPEGKFIEETKKAFKDQELTIKNNK